MSLLYKYREWSNSFHKKIITAQELYFTTPDKFNDPFDCFIKLKFEALKGDKLKEYQVAMHGLLKQDPIFENIKLSEVRKAKSFKNLADFSRRHLLEMTKDVGIVSLSSRFDNILMWSHYAQNHRGFCIGLDISSSMVSSMKGTTLQPVKYREDYPTIVPSTNFVDDLHEQLTTKSIDWKYELEQRLISNSYINSAYKFPKENLKRIVFGSKMSKTHKSEIVKAVKDCDYPNVDFYNASQSDSEFKIVTSKLSHIEIKDLEKFKPKK